MCIHSIYSVYILCVLFCGEYRIFLCPCNELVIIVSLLNPFTSKASIRTEETWETGRKEGCAASFDTGYLPPLRRLGWDGGHAPAGVATMELSPGMHFQELSLNSLRG